MTTVEFYKEKIDNMRKNFDQVFKDQRDHFKIIEGDKEWKKFKKDSV